MIVAMMTLRSINSVSEWPTIHWNSPVVCKGAVMLSDGFVSSVGARLWWEISEKEIWSSTLRFPARNLSSKNTADRC